MRKNLIELRGDRTQMQVSQEIGISQKYLSAIELGFRTPSIEVMKKLQNYYKKSIVELFPEVFSEILTTKSSN